MHHAACMQWSTMPSPGPKHPRVPSGISISAGKATTKAWCASFSTSRHMLDASSRSLTGAADVVMLQAGIVFKRISKCDGYSVEHYGRDTCPLSVRTRQWVWHIDIMVTSWLVSRA